MKINYFFTHIVLAIFVLILSNAQLFSQCGYGSAGSTCGSATGGNNRGTITPSTTLQSIAVPNGASGYFQFSVPFAGMVYEFYTCGSSDIELIAGKSDGTNTIARDNDNQNCGGSGNNEYMRYSTLTTGVHNIRVSQNNNCVNITNTNVVLYYRIVFQPCSVAPAYGVDLWNSYVYDGVDLNYLYGLIGSQTWNSLSYNWGTSQPITTGSCGIMCDADNYSTRHLMSHTFPCGSYRFTYSSDDGIRISVDGGATWIVNLWDNTTHSGTVDVFLGGLKQVVVEHREVGGAAQVSVSIALLNAISVTTDAGADATICNGESVTLNATSSIGSLTTTVGTATANDLIYPYNTYWHDARSQFLIYASEMTAAGMSAGYLNSIAFNINSANAATMNNFNIRVKHSGLSALTDYEAGLTTVFSGSYAVPGTGWQSVVFQTPFNWDGVSNIIIEFCFDNTTYTTYSYLDYRTTTTNRFAYLVADNSSGCSLTAPYLGSLVPIVRFNFTPQLNYLWTPSTGLNSTTILNSIASPTSTTNYTLTATYNGCSATDQVTITVQNPAGDPTVFGNNVWNVYGYNGDNTNLAVNTYRGYYIQPDLGGGNYGVNTQTFWSNGNSPSDAGVAINTGNIWNGCTVTPDYHTVVQKRKGFPCGTYNLNMMDWDDETRVYLDGALIWSCAAWSGAGTCPTGNIGMFALDGDSELEIRSFEQAGGSNVNMQVIAVSPTELSLNGATRTCRVSGGNAFIFFLDPTGRFIAAINPQNQDLGYVTMTSYVDVTNGLVPACDYPTSPEYMTSVMQRHWVATPTVQPVTPVEVGLPFTNAELASLITASNANANGFDNVALIGDVILSKYHGPANVNNNAIDNCLVSGGNENTTLHFQSGNGDLATVFPGFVATSFAIYAIPNFSELWLNGSSNLSPLPIELTSFAAICNETGDNADVQWTTASEHNSSHFVVDRSLDGQNWETLGSIAAAGNSTSSLHYALKDNDTRGHSVIYYRLNQYDQDGALKTYGPISAECMNDQKGFELFPNPAGTDVTVLLHGDYENGIAQLVFTDMNGKEVKKILFEDDMSQLISIDLRNLEPGVYIVRLIDGETNSQFVRLVKQ